MSRIRIAALLAVIALIPAAAEAQSTITACYVPKTGSVYRIQAPGAPAACKNGHTEFSWDSSAPASVGYAVRTGTAVLVPAQSSATASVSCAEGEVAVGGGYHINQGVLVSARLNRPIDDGTGWVVYIVNPGEAEYWVTAYVTCLALPN